MRIGYDAKRLFCNLTGLGNYSRTLVHNLQAHFPQNEYYLYTPELKQLTVNQPFIQNKAYTINVSKAKLKALWRSFGIVKQLQKDCLDVYHGLSNEIPICLHKTGVKSIVTIHDLIFKTHPKTYAFFDRQMYDIKFKNSCLQADKIIAISQSTKNDLVNYYKIAPEKIEVIYQSCNAQYFDETPTNKIPYNLPDTYLLYVGSVIPRKNLELIVKAYTILPTDFTIPVVVVGDGKTYKKRMKQLIQRYGLGEKFIWLDKVNSIELKALYQHAQVLIYPSLYEGFGLPVAEALLCKTPVITSNTSSLKEAGGSESIYINPNDATELADAIERVLDDNILRTQMKELGFKYAHQHFSAVSCSEKMMACYKQIYSKG